MRQIKADPQRRIDIPGVPAPVSRPVDIDRSQTGFTKLRSLRIYRFEAGSVIDGHAEEDEVLIVVLVGSIELILMENNSSDTAQAETLTAAGDAPGYPCAAYLPPHGAYRLTAKGACDVAYARATPASGPPPAVFRSQAGLQQDDAAILLEEASYPRQLRVRLMQITAGKQDKVVRPQREEEAAVEALIHIRTVPDECGATLTVAGQTPVALTSWDSVAIAPGERPILEVAMHSSALVLVMLAF